MGYSVGIDLGTTYTAAAVARDGRIDIVTLGNRSVAIPSVAFLRDDEALLTGEAAARRGSEDPTRFAREFKRRLGDETPIMLGRSPYSAERLMAMVLRDVLDRVRELEGGDPDSIVVSHPANWGPYKIELLRQAVSLAGQPGAEIISEPEAAAIHYAAVERIDVGATVAVYDLGGGTFDASVLRKTASGFEIVGDPSGIERLGGIDFDAAVFEHVRHSVGADFDALDQSDPAVASALATLREECTNAKEALSEDVEANVRVVAPSLHTSVRITRVEFEDMIRPLLRETIEALRRAVHSAGVRPEELTSVLLVGGSSRIPLAGEMVSQELGRPVAIDTHPKHVVALGAARVATTGQTGAAPPPPPPTVPAPDADELNGGPAPRPGTHDRSRQGLLLALGAAGAIALVAVIWFLSTGDDPQTADPPDVGGGDTATTVSVPDTQSTTSTSTSTSTSTTLPADEDCTTARTLTRWVCLEEIRLDGDQYVISFSGEFAGETLSISDGTHLHVFGSDLDPSRAGNNVENPGSWVRMDTLDEFTVSISDSTVLGNDPEKICAVVADARPSVLGAGAAAHSYFDPQNGNCIPIPSS